MELSRAETSVGKLEAIWIKCARIAIASLLAPMLVGFGLIILALREEYVYKKSFNRRFKALH
jgi:hypothetical protein